MIMTIHSAASTRDSTAATSASGIAAAGGRAGGDNLTSASQATAPASRRQAAAATASATASATANPGARAAAPAASPLFAHLLGMTHGAAGEAIAADAAAEDQQDPAETANPANAGALLPAMAGSLFVSAMPAQVPASATPLMVPGTAADTTATADQAPTESARSDTLAISTLNPAATPFNLSAAGIAVHTATGAAPVVAPVAQADARPSVTAAEPQAAAMALAATAATGAPVAAARPGVTTAPPSAAKPAAAADVSLPRVAVRVTGVPADADAAPASNTASLASSARDDSQGTGKFASALAGVANAAPGAPVAAAPAGAANAAVVKLAGAPEQWQQPLREALGDRLQVNLQRNNDHAVIRLDPPNMGSIEISIRHSAGALQVSLSASNSEVVRQLNAIGDNVRQDLSNRQFTEVAVTVSSARAPSQGQAQADTGRQREQQEQERDRAPGRALHGDDAANTFAMNDQE
jgi:flagellar hook-length control protein FliK